jgi:hypothetical protein
MNEHERLNKQKIAKQIYRLKNKEIGNDRDKAYEERNKEKNKERRSLFYVANKERLNKERCERRRSQKLRNKITVEL